MEIENNNVPIDHLGGGMLIPPLSPEQVQAILDDEDICECCKHDMLDDEARERFFGLQIPDRPDLTSLKKQVLRFGGERFERNDVLDEELSREMVKEMQRRGRPFSGQDAEIWPMLPSECDKNVLVLAVREKIQWWTGFASSDDGVWRLHCWGLDQGRVVETTERRRQYFGVSVPVLYWTQSAVARHVKRIERTVEEFYESEKSNKKQMAKDGQLPKSILN